MLTGVGLMGNRLHGQQRSIAVTVFYHCRGAKTLVRLIYRQLHCISGTSPPDLHILG
jgi:hypothetical protein